MDNMDCWVMVAVVGGAIGCTGGVAEVIVDDMSGIGKDEQVLWCDIGCIKESLGGQKSSVGVPMCDIGGLESFQGKWVMHLLAGDHPLCMPLKSFAQGSALLLIFSRICCSNSAQLPIENTKQS